MSGYCEAEVVIVLNEQIPAEELRALYIRANLRQRYRVAASRIANPEHGPNQVVSAVAALEGFSRAVAVKGAVLKGEALDDAYSRLKWTGPLELIQDYILPALGVAAEDAFDIDKWSLIPTAIEFRNLLVHEATYLHGGTCQHLVDAVVHVFERVGVLVGVDPGAA